MHEIGEVVKPDRGDGHRSERSVERVESGAKRSNLECRGLRRGELGTRWSAERMTEAREAVGVQREAGRVGTSAGQSGGRRIPFRTDEAGRDAGSKCGKWLRQLMHPLIVRGVRSRRRPLDTRAVPAACSRTSPSMDESGHRANWEDGDTASAPAGTTSASAASPCSPSASGHIRYARPPRPNTDSTAIANALTNSRRSRRSGRDTCIDDRPIPKRMSLMSRNPASIPQRLP